MIIVCMCDHPKDKHHPKDSDLHKFDLCQVPGCFCVQFQPVPKED